MLGDILAGKAGTAKLIALAVQYRGLESVAGSCGIVPFIPKSDLDGFNAHVVTVFQIHKFHSCRVMSNGSVV